MSPPSSASRACPARCRWSGIVHGRCFAGNAALLGCCDVIIATANASIGMGGPAMIEGGGLGRVQADEVGPVSVQGPNGVIDLLVADEAAAVAAAKRYLGYFQGVAAGRRAGRRRGAVVAPGAAGQPQCAVRPARHHRHGDGRGQRARAASRVRRRRDHRAGAHRRPAGGRGRQPAAPPGRRARCAGLRQARALHAAGRCLRPADHHLRRHARLHGRAGEREDGDGAPRRAACSSPRRRCACRCSA